MNTLEKEKATEISCPVSKEGRRSFKKWVRRIGWAGFFFFLVKGLLWLIIPYLIARGIISF